jgi:hypothetical protein
MVAGIICMCFGSEKIPQNYPYDADNPMPSDQAVVDTQLKEYQAKSYGYYLVIVGGSLVGGFGGTLIISSILVERLDSSANVLPVDAEIKPVRRVHFSNNKITPINETLTVNRVDNLPVVITVLDERLDREKVLERENIKLRAKLRQWIGARADDIVL